MSASAANLWVLLRRRAGALAPWSPSPALLQPLFPVPYLKQTRSLLHAAAAAVGGPLDSRSAQLCPAAVVPPSSLLHRYSGKSYGATPPWKPAYRPVMRGQVPTAAINLPDKRHIQLSPLPMFSIIHHYSSKEGGLPGPKQPTDRQVMQHLKQGNLHCRTDAYTEILIGKLKDMTEETRMMRETLEETRMRANHLLERLDEEDFAMLEKRFDDALKELALYEKELDDFTGAVGSCKVLQPEALEKIQMYCNELEDLNKIMRQTLKELLDSVEKVKTLNKHMKRELSSFDGILETLWKHVKAILAVALGTCVLLILMSILLGIFI